MTEEDCLTFLSNTRGGAPCFDRYLLALASISFLSKLLCLARVSLLFLSSASKLYCQTLLFSWFNCYLIKLLVMFLYGGPIFHPNFHPKTLVLLQLCELTQFSLGLGVSGVAFTVLLFPGLVKSSEGLLCSVPGLRSHLPVL